MNKKHISICFGVLILLTLSSVQAAVTNPAQQPIIERTITHDWEKITIREGPDLIIIKSEPMINSLEQLQVYKTARLKVLHSISATMNPKDEIGATVTLHHPLSRSAVDVLANKHDFRLGYYEFIGSHGVRGGTPLITEHFLPAREKELQKVFGPNFRLVEGLTMLQGAIQVKHLQKFQNTPAVFLVDIGPQELYAERSKGKPVSLASQNLFFAVNKYMSSQIPLPSPKRPLMFDQMHISEGKALSLGYRSLAIGEGDEVLYLPFESIVDNEWEDLSGYNNDGINHNAVVTGGAPKVGGNAAYLAYYSYPGSPGPDWIDLGDDYSLKLDKTDFTIAFWHKFADYGWNNPTSACIFFNTGGGDNGADPNQMIWLGIVKVDLGGGNYVNRIKLGFYGPNVVFDYNLPFVTYTHIAITFNYHSSPDYYATLYINGNYYQTKAMGGYPDYWAWNGAELGRHYKGTYGGAYWEGRLDELHVYKRVLVKEEIAELYNYVKNEPYLDIEEINASPHPADPGDYITTNVHVKGHLAGNYVFVGIYDPRAAEWVASTQEYRSGNVDKVYTLSFTATSAYPMSYQPVAVYYWDGAQWVHEDSGWGFVTADEFTRYGGVGDGWSPDCYTPATQYPQSDEYVDYWQWLWWTDSGRLQKLKDNTDSWGGKYQSELSRSKDYWDFVYSGPPPTYQRRNYGWDSNIPGATWENSEESWMLPPSNNEEAQTDTEDTENLVLNLVSEPSYAYGYGYYVYYRFYRHEKDRGKLLTIWTESELNEYKGDALFSGFDIVEMTRQKEVA